MHTFSVEDGDAATMSSTAQKNRFASSWFALRLAGMLLIGLVLGAVVAAASHFSFANAMAGNRDDGMRPFTEPSPATASTTLAPVLGDGTAVEWWFAFKPTTAAFPRCSRNVSCMFGGEAMAFENPPRFGLQYILASRGLDGTTQPLQLHSDCIGNGEDPLAKTFQQDQKGDTFLKLSATNFTINSLICGKAARNASLAGGPKMQELKNLRNSKLSHTPAEVQDEEPPAKRRRSMETVVEVDVHGTLVSLLCPSKRPQVADVMVKMDPQMLSAVFKFLLPDCLEETASRSYKKSGAFAKDKQKED
ncbi:unnamed protein product [Cladocopium goreaui]|uniref:Uncharacterized protein n=2 Tax=Cladocopium goreaui TaxID=2562237 RepID=A0A9P1CTA3_9DINO|nr:unnamed protein product [Cladocopium goreaui]